MSSKLVATRRARALQIQNGGRVGDSAAPHCRGACRVRVFDVPCDLDLNDFNKTALHWVSPSYSAPWCAAVILTERNGVNRDLVPPADAQWPSPRLHGRAPSTWDGFRDPTARMRLAWPRAVGTRIQPPNYLLRWRILARMRRFLRPSLRRPLPVFLVPTHVSYVCWLGESRLF